MKNKRVKILESDVNGDFLYIGHNGTVISGPMLSNGLVCYFVEPDSDLPESLFRQGSIEVIDNGKVYNGYNLVKVLEPMDFSTLTVAQQSMIGKIFSANEEHDATYNILGTKFTEDQIEKVGLGSDFIRRLFEIHDSISIEAGLIKIHNDLVKYKTAYERLANERLSIDS